MILNFLSIVLFPSFSLHTRLKETLNSFNLMSDVTLSSEHSTKITGKPVAVIPNL